MIGTDFPHTYDKISVQLKLKAMVNNYEEMEEEVP